MLSYVCSCVCVWLVCVGLCGAVICTMTISGLRVNPNLGLGVGGSLAHLMRILLRILL